MRKILLTLMATTFVLVASDAQTVEQQCSRVVTNGPKTEAKLSKGLMKHSLSNANVTILQQKTVGKGVTMQLVRDSKGRTYKVVDKGDGKAQLLLPKRGVQHKASSNCSFSEDFESWQEDYGMEWLPEGWTEINTEGNIPTEAMLEHNIDNTWYTYYTGDGSWIPATSDGEKDCFIHFAYNASYKDTDGNQVEIPATAQDEWLISPAFTVQEGHNLYFDSSFDIGSAIQFDWNEMVYNHDVVENTLSVEVSTDGGESWTKVWDIVDDYASLMTDDELYDNMNMKYRSYTVDLSAYQGKTIQIAFRYINVATNGFTGNSAAVDAVMVGAPAAEAKYDLPYGTLMAGLSEDFYCTTETVALLPAYADVEWQDGSNSYTDNVEWTFEPGNQTDEIITSTERNPIMNYPYTSTGMPILKASNSVGSDTFSWRSGDEETPRIQYGGCVTDAKGTPFGLGNYDYQHYGFTTPYFSTGSYCFGTGSDDTWGATVVGVANLFEKPAAPLYVDKAYLTLQYIDADDDAELYLNVYGFDEWGYLSDVIATAKAKVSDMYTDIGFHTLPFKFYTTNEQGEEVDTVFILDRDALFEVTGFADNDKVRTFAAMTQGDNHESGKNYAYLNFEFKRESGNITRWYAASDALSDYNSSLLLSLNGVYSFVHSDETEVVLPADGGEEGILMYLYDMDNMRLQIDGKWHGLYEDNYDWLNIYYIAPTSELPHDFVCVYFSAQAAPEDRETTLTFESLGASQTIHVKQMKSTSIGTAKQSASKLSTSLKGDKLDVVMNDSNSAQAVSLYSADGVLIGKLHTDSDGKASFNVSSLTNGVYLVKSGNSSVKIVK